MRLFTLLIGLFFLISSYAQNWTSLNVPASIRYDDIYFFNSSTGFTINSDGKVLKTTNGGVNWVETSNLNQYLRCIEFVNEKVGFIGSLDSSLFITQDSGKTWQNITSQLNTPFKIPGVCGISIIDSTVYTCGKWSHPGYIIKSNDAGLSWIFQNLDSLSNGLVELEFWNNNTGLVAGKSNKNLEGGLILKTDNGGQTWRKVYTSNLPNEYVWKLQRIKPGVIVGSIQGNPASNALRIVKSEDDGETWETLTLTDTFYQSQTIGFLNDAYGVTGGIDQLFETLDSGKTWQKINLGASHNRFFKVSDSLAFLTGEKIYKTTAAIPKGLTQVHSNNHQFKINQRQQTIEISYYLPQKSHTQLGFVDVTGKNLHYLENSFLNKGDHNLSVSKMNLNQGIYFFFLHTNFGISHQKVFIIK